MNITITILYADLQKIISESPTMNSLMNGVEIVKTVNPIVSFRNKWFKSHNVSSMDEHQKRHPEGNSKITAINVVREHFALSNDKAFAKQAFKEKYETRLNDLDQTVLTLAAAKSLVEKYFY